MKKRTTKILSVILAILMLCTAVPMTAGAAEMFTEGYYTYTVTDGEATITAVDASISGDITVPSTLGGYQVTSIGEEAFYDCDKLSSIILPDSLESIGGLAFALTSLTTLNIPENVKKIDGPIVVNSVFKGYSVDEKNQYFSVDDNGDIFNKDKTKLIHHILNLEEKEYTIPETVTEIGYRALAYNFYIEKINIPDTVEVIEKQAFEGCYMLKELNFPRNLKKLGCFSEYGAALFGVDKLTIPEDVTFLCKYDTNVDSENAEEYAHNHYTGIDEILMYPTNELTVYDIDFDFTDFKIGLTPNFKCNPEGFKLYKSLVSCYYADIGAKALGYDIKVEEPEFNEDDLYDKTAEPAEPDAEIDGVAYYAIPGFTVRCYKGSTAEEYAKKYGFNIKYICDEHTEGHVYNAVVTAPTCSEQGYTTYTCECGDSYVGDYVAVVDHNDTDGDYLCDYCDEDLYADSEEETPSTEQFSISEFLKNIFNWIKEIIEKIVDLFRSIGDLT